MIDLKLYLDMLILSNCQKVNIKLVLRVWGQNPLTFMIPIHGTTVLIA